MSARNFYSFLISFFAGVLAFSFAHGSSMLLLCASIASAGGALITEIFKRHSLVLAFICMTSFSLGALRMEISEAGNHLFDASVGKKIALSGFICDDPALKDLSQTLCFQPDGSNDKILVTTGRYSSFSYGQEVRIAGKLELPENFLTYEGGPEFDYVSYLAKDDIRYTMYLPRVTRLSGYGGNRVIGALFSIKSALTAQMRALLPEPEASLLGGLLLGDRQSMPKSVASDFKRAGLVHILVLSGYNVTIIAESLMKALSFLPALIAKSLGALSIVLFALMTGASATTVRATIMALIVILVRSAGRRYDVTRALLVAAFLMVMQNPRILAFDVSFELSFLATLALIFVSPLVLDRLGFVTERWKLRETLATTIATQIFVLPFLLYVMGQTSIVALVSNIFVLPAVPYSMSIGFIMVLIGFANQTAALPAAWAVNLFLTYIIRSVAFFARFPFALIEMHANVWTLACMYAVYIALLIWLWRRRGSSPRSSAN